MKERDEDGRSSDIESMLRSIIVLFESGAVYYDQEGNFLETDFDRVYDFGKVWIALLFSLMILALRKPCCRPSLQAIVSFMNMKGDAASLNRG